MNLLLKPAVTLVTSWMVLSFSSLPKEKISEPPLKMKSKIQAAILLDVSNSMDGLIDQAKAQLWNMVSVMGKAKCDGETPQIEIALYEYGRTSNDVNKGYVKQISPFTSDLDKLSEHLFSLTTYGGDEYCGQVIHSSLDELNWDADPNSYKVIFISGNEDFLQGKMHYTLACNEAKKKGVIVNTIYCGDRLQGIKEHWNLSAECGNGSFTNINSDARPEEIPTPYDSTLITLNDKLNGTYIYYGAKGQERKALQYSMDQNNTIASASAGVNRIAVKGKKATYNNAGWDLIDAKDEDKRFLEKVDFKTLPDSLQNKTTSELEAIVNEKANERNRIQNEIQEISAKREIYINWERTKKIKNNTDQTLQTEVEKIMREQAKRYNMKIE
ncbi:MAG TPA: vWA domain-containing protein [Chitinophagaceae bacterium]|nr:vWA domain-containing protein [Chitinophagaceae bacterium]